MSKSRQSTLRTSLVHVALIAYTLVSLFPVFLTIINSFKSKQAIFGQPLRLPSPSTFSLIGYETVLKQGDFFLYFQNSLIVTVASLFFVLLFGAMAAFALSEYRFRGNTLMGLYLALGIMIPIRIGTVAILEMMVSAGLVNTLMALILPAIGIISILTFVGNFNAFDLIYVAQGALAGPDFSTDILGTFLYRTFFGFQLQLGDPYMGSAIAGAMFGIILVGVCIYLFGIQTRLRRYQF